MSTVRAWTARHPRGADAVLALVVYVVLSLAVTTSAVESGPWWLPWVANLGPAAPVVVRRSAPVAALLVSLVAVVVVVVAVGPTGGEAAVLVLVATAVSRGRSRRELSAALLATGLAVVVTGLLQDDPPLAVANAALLCAVASAVGLAARARRRELAATEERAAREADLAVVRERARIAREVHDVVSHNVSVMIALAGGVERTAGRDDAREGARQIGATGREALGELRALLGVLVSETPDEPQPGLDRIADLVEGVRRSGVEIDLEERGTAPAPAVVQLSAYRIVQEALTNAVRHARGLRTIRVRMLREPDHLLVEVLDDGEQAAGGVRPGRGITGMRERAALHGATVAAGPSPTGGWRVTVALPTQEGAP